MIIGISGKKRSGKDTISNFLIDNYDFIKYGFADPIKDIAKIIFGFTDEQLYGNLKEKIDDRWGISPRNFFQKFGTEYGRCIFQEHFPEIFDNHNKKTLNKKTLNKKTLWVLVFKKWYLKKIKENPSIKIVINDVRFIDEYNCIKELGGYILKVERNNLIVDQHISENDLDKSFENDKTLEYDTIIENNGTLQDLYDKIIEIIN